MFAEGDLERGFAEADVVVEQATAAGTTVSYTPPTVADAADPSPTVSCTPASGTTFQLGEHTIVIRVQDQYQIQCLGEQWIRDVLLGWHRVHHVQEVFCITEIIDRVNKWLTHRIAITPGCNSGHLGY